MSVLISSSPPIAPHFLDLYQEYNNRRGSAADLNVTKSHYPTPYKKQISNTLPFGRRKKSVVFADYMGLPLTRVKMLKVEELEPAPPPIRHLPKTPGSNNSPSITLLPSLRPNFQQPMTRLDFLDTIRQNHVGLESVHVSNSLTLTGSVLVHNICFEKTVKIRYTRNYWKSHQDITAEFSRSFAPDLDKFSFSLTIAGCLGSVLEFCVCAELGGEEIWDNNSGQNYQVEVTMLPPSSSSLQNNLAAESPVHQSSFSTSRKGIYY